MRVCWGLSLSSAATGGGEAASFKAMAGAASDRRSTKVYCE